MRNKLRYQNIPSSECRENEDNKFILFNSSAINNDEIDKFNLLIKIAKQ